VKAMHKASKYNADYDDPPDEDNCDFFRRDWAFDTMSAFEDK
jgi:hypothetical protein